MLAHGAQTRSFHQVMESHLPAPADGLWPEKEKPRPRREARHSGSRQLSAKDQFFFAAQGLQALAALQGFLAAHGLHFAAQGLHLAAQGLHLPAQGLQAFAAPHADLCAPA
jgi:hypothetical protein